MKQDMIYLDYNATSWVKSAVREAMSEVMVLPLNASSVHGFGRKAKKYLETAKENILEMAGAQGHTLIFTSCGTEANNLALRGFNQADSMIVSAVEHPSVLKAVCSGSGGIIPVDENGLVEIDVLKIIMGNSKGRSLVSVMMANNETGVIQPIKEISELVVSTGGFVHCDASQAFGKIPVNFNDLNVDMMTISAHKFGGPQGIAALIVKKGIELEPIIVGGNQENRMRAGTENIAGIVGFGTAAKLVGNPMDSTLRDYIESEIEASAPNAVIFAKDVERLPNTTCVAIPNLPNDTQLIAFDLKNIAVSNGSACSSGTVERSHVLKAMNVDKELANCAIRVSVSPNTTKDEVDAFLKVWKRNYKNAMLNDVAA